MTRVRRVVVTTAHNVMMPAVRYDILDGAEAGEPYGCGRGLSVLRRILRTPVRVVRTRPNAA